MKTLPAGMQDHLDSRATTLCFCWKITLTDGVVQGFTDHDTDLTFDSVTYAAATGFTPSAVKQALGSAVDDMELIGFLSADAISEEDIQNKLYDSAAISVFRVNWQDLNQRVEIFTGQLGTVTRGPISFKSEVRSLRQLMAQPIGESYTNTCRVDLGSTPCGIDLTSDPTYQITGTVTTVLNKRTFTTTTADVVARPTGWFAGGLISWTSGNNNGAIIEVKRHLLSVGDAAEFDMWEQVSRDIQIGDTFIAQVGCDKLITTCREKFNNVNNFRGFPRMPKTDISLQVATSYEPFANATNGGSWYK